MKKKSNTIDTKYKGTAAGLLDVSRCHWVGGNFTSETREMDFLPGGPLILSLQIFSDIFS